MRRDNFVAATWVLSFFSVMSLVFTISTIKQNTEINRRIQRNRAAISEIVSNLEALDSALGNSFLLKNPKTAGLACAEIYSKAQSTEKALEFVPFPMPEIDKTMGFVNSAGDFAFSLTQKSAEGEKLTQEELDLIKSLSETSTELCDELSLAFEDKKSANAI